MDNSLTIKESTGRSEKLSSAVTAFGKSFGVDLGTQSI